MNTASDPVWLVYVAADPEAGDKTMGQAVLDVPAGRYLIDTWDISAASWVAHESAAGPPLVVGVPARSGGVILRISPCYTDDQP